MSNVDKIRIIRQQHTRYIENSCLMKTEVKLTLFIPKNNRYYIYPFGKYLSNLKASTQDGTDLITLPHHEFFSEKIDIRKQASSIVKGIAEEELQSAENFAVILLPEEAHDYYEQLTLSWYESIEKNRQRLRLFSKSIPIEREFLPMGDSSLYVELKVSEKYQIMNKPRVDELKTETYGLQNEKHISYFSSAREEQYDKVIEDKKNNILRFPRNFDKKLKISWLVGISGIIESSVWLGFILGIMISIVLFFDPFGNHVTITFAMGLGIIAYLTGLRVVVLHDIELMNRWNSSNFILVIILVLLLIKVGISHTYSIIY